MGPSLTPTSSQTSQIGGSKSPPLKFQPNSWRSMKMSERHIWEHISKPVKWCNEQSYSFRQSPKRLNADRPQCAVVEQPDQYHCGDDLVFSLGAYWKYKTFDGEQNLLNIGLHLKTRCNSLTRHATQCLHGRSTIIRITVGMRFTMKRMTHSIGARHASLSSCSNSRPASDRRRRVDRPSCVHSTDLSLRI